MANDPGRRCAIAEPNRVWAADITARPTTTGWGDLAVILDFASRRVGGGATATTLATDLGRTALQRTVATRPIPRGLLHHSDRGSQYASEASQRNLARAGSIARMSRVGDCWANAPVERFFSGLKAEGHAGRGLGHRCPGRGRCRRSHRVQQLDAAHSAIRYRSPVDYETERRAPL